MELNRRQHSILKELIDNKEKFYSSVQLAESFDVSVRTIKNDLNIIKDYVQQFDSFTLSSVVGKGTKIVVLNKDKFISKATDILKQSLPITSFDERNRNLSILKYLINNNSRITKHDLLSEFYISESTFYNSYKRIKKILNEHNLDIEYTRQHGYKITGSEINKRSFIAKFEIGVSDIDPYKQSERLSDVYHYVADTFLDFKYAVNEQVLQNISSHVLLSIERVQNGFTISGESDQDLTKLTEYEIALQICDEFLRFLISDGDQFHNEVNLLTLNILGKMNYTLDEDLQEDINKFIDEAYESINQQFNVNFKSVEKLKLFLALHLVPLFYRVKSGTQLHNQMANDVQQQFPLANDIALYFSILIKEKFNLSISTGELSYLVIYFNFGLEELKLFKSSKKVLVLTSLRTSETVLLRHRLINWFPEQIMDIEFVHPMATYELDDYDAIFTTEAITDEFKGAVTPISIFPEDSDYGRINMALNGYTEVSTILNKFKESCFGVAQFNSKKEVLSFVCDNAIKEYQLDKEFSHHIFNRELIESTYFGNGVAMPHPLSPITNETFVSIAISKKPITWDMTHQVNFVMLISIEKDNPKAYQLWYYLSDMIRNADTIRKLTNSNDFNEFISTLEKTLSI